MTLLTQTRSRQPGLWQVELDALSRIGPWKTVDDILSYALDLLLDSRPDLRREMALNLYQRNEITLSRAAELAGTTRWDLARCLKERGTPVIVEVAEPAEMDRDLAAFLDRLPRFDPVAASALAEGCGDQISSQDDDRADGEGGASGIEGAGTDLCSASQVT